MREREGGREGKSEEGEEEEKGGRKIVEFFLYFHKRGGEIKDSAHLFLRAIFPAFNIIRISFNFDGYGNTNCRKGFDWLVLITSRVRNDPLFADGYHQQPYTSVH